MPLTGFSHVNVRTARLAEMVEWYTDILGMKTGPRPDFAFDGAWLYLGDNPFIHLVSVLEDPRTQDPKIEHFAFDATGMAAFAESLASHGVAFTIDPVPGFPLVQINCHDPDGNHIHIDFARAEAETAGLV
ncbi:Glyoxalase-like domain protein [Roseivivax sp. THAF40]|uniref:VOC family protein n=1 Tax=unclassified Roseivivax TaxID=2639302 RepID=UPI001267CAED|nr:MULTISPECIES: VOC family protein [unclassified Roseivivax]QFS82576.1 Glyoxalase-like domain protein [Roseivivax sp. THAF197b]QFT46345.1 Glyoxalase-like domain protein [Roseivivax sp. THAF40]